MPACRAIATVPDVPQGEQGRLHALAAFWNYGSAHTETKGRTRERTRAQEPERFYGSLCCRGWFKELRAFGVGRQLRSMTFPGRPDRWPS